MDVIHPAGMHLLLGVGCPIVLRPGPPIVARPGRHIVVRPVLERTRQAVKPAGTGLTDNLNFILDFWNDC